MTENYGINFYNIYANYLLSSIYIYRSFSQNIINLIVNFICAKKLLKQSIKSKRSLECKCIKR